MSKLELFYPVKPLHVNQAFGIFNPAYKTFGFTHHNGIDYATDTDQLAYAMCDGYITDVGYNEGAGHYVRYMTDKQVQAEGITGYVEFMYMHAEKVLVKKHAEVKAGDPLIVCDNTGFSTGQHLHVSAYFVDVTARKQKYGKAETNWCFDFSKYYNRYFAVDAQKVFSLYYKVIALLQSYLNK